MKGLIIILNRVYFLLTRVNNQSPFLGAVILVTLLISSMILSIWLGVFAFKDVALHMQSVTYFLIIFIVFTLLYLFARKNKEKFIFHNVNGSVLKNIYVLSLYIVAFGTFIFLSNVNREKIFKNRGTSIIKSKNQSLESDIRTWFAN